MSRKIARDELFKLVFECEIKEESPVEVLESYLKREEATDNKNALEFIKKYMNGIAQNNTKILEIINNNIVGWSYERIGNVEKALLKCAVYELEYENTPYEIVINEVVEIAKVYGDEKTYEFVNGVLAKIINK